MTGGIRNQQTLSQPAGIRGIGFFSGADVAVRCLPAAEDHGVVFCRTDLPGRPSVAADISNLVPSPRRTTIRHGDAEVSLIEHLMAALAGLQIDNVLVEIDGPEVPGCDGSAREFCERLLDAGIDQQSAPARIAAVFAPWSTIDRDAGCEVAVRPHIRPLQAITYQLDYGPRSPIRAQRLTIELTPEVFLRDICWARTFVLEAEVRQLRAAGFGSRVTERDLLVFGPDGVVGNTLRSADECARHKILDSIGDLALSGHQIHGHFMAWRSGHRHNHEVVRALPQFALPLEPHRSAA